MQDIQKNRAYLSNEYRFNYALNVFKRVCGMKFYY